MTDWLDILATPLPVAEAVAFVQEARAEAWACSWGQRGRRIRHGAPLVALEYEAYGEMATAQLADLAKRARAVADLEAGVAAPDRAGGSAVRRRW